MKSKNLLGPARPFAYALGLFLIGTFTTSCTYDSVEPDVCFETDVLPVFASYCSSGGCHNPTDRVDGYDLTNYEGIMRGVKPKSVMSSKLLQSMRKSSGEPMPPKSYPQPSGAQIATIKAWVRSGAANTTNCATSTCDTSAAVTYSANIQPLLATYCIGCHSGSNASGNIELVSFSGVQQSALDGSLAGSLKGDPDFSFMPPNSRPLPDCDIYQIEKWVAAGAKEN